MIDSYRKKRVVVTREGLEMTRDIMNTNKSEEEVVFGVESMDKRHNNISMMNSMMVEKSNKNRLSSKQNKIRSNRNIRGGLEIDTTYESFDISNTDTGLNNRISLLSTGSSGLYQKKKKSKIGRLSQINYMVNESDDHGRRERGDGTQSKSVRSWVECSLGDRMKRLLKESNDNKYIKMKIQSSIDQINEYKSILRDNKSMHKLFEFLNNKNSNKLTKRNFVNSGEQNKTTALSSIKIHDIDISQSINQADLQQTLKDRFKPLQKYYQRLKKTQDIVNYNKPADIKETENPKEKNIWQYNPQTFYKKGLLSNEKTSPPELNPLHTPVQSLIPRSIISLNKRRVDTKSERIYLTTRKKEIFSDISKVSSTNSSMQGSHSGRCMNISSYII